ncbi:hypothetical protein FE257_004552 [Aspergillus nanangensis]|uniref:Uncharacterized protein n=1 Tax=Aspergillus nanangensis TaxID=2582783 RepID=A0AAD4CY84_ASPNN|nr:hypothetical protein FE257_004552 [Aspergillus nanangensis]
MTRIQIQPRLDTLLSEWSLQTQAPSPTTFWDGLTAADKEESVNQQHSWPFDGQYAWDAVGKVKQSWDTSIYPNILEPLLEDNSKRIFRRIQKRPPYNITCWLVGSEWRLTHPAAVFICGNTRVTQRAVELIEKHGDLKSWGFRVYGFKSKIALNMGDTAFVSDLENTTNVCGRLFSVGNMDGVVFSKTATIGGSIMLGETPYGVTVVHPFFRLHDNEPADDDDFESDDESLTSDSENTFNEDNPISLSADAIYTQSGVTVVHPFFRLHDDEPADDDDFESDDESLTSDSENTFNEDNPISLSQSGTARFKLLGSIPHKGPYYSLQTDWALLELSTTHLDEKPILNYAVLNDTISFPSKVSPSPSETPLWAAVGTGTPVETNAPGTISGLYVEPFGLQDVWALRMQPVPGNSGSWVINPLDDSIFGVIVAGAETIGVSYALPASRVFDEIRDRFPDMRFPSPEDSQVLLHAAEVGATKTLQRVLEKIHPNEINGKDSLGPDALMWACSNGHDDAVRILLNAGLDINCRNSWGSTPLVLAVECENTGLVRLLLNTPGVDINHPGTRGRTPLSHAVAFGQENVVRILLDRPGVDINHPDTDGRTPLSLAAKFGLKRIVRILLDRPGVDINHPDICGRTPLSYAAEEGYEDIVDSLLKSKSVIVDCVDKNGDTPLMLAVASGHARVVRLLLEVGGASTTMKNVSGMTAKDLSLQREDFPIEIFGTFKSNDSMVYLGGLSAPQKPKSGPVQGLDDPYLRAKSGSSTQDSKSAQERGFHGNI